MVAVANQVRVQRKLTVPSGFSDPARRMDAMQRHPRRVFKIFFIIG